MRVIRSLERARGLFQRPVVTMGNFDGVHRGHQVILRQLVDDARQRGVSAVVLTFDPHPVSVVRPEAAPRLLMPLGDRLAALSACGVDATVVQRFSPGFAEVEAETFIAEFLVEILDVQKLVVGHDLNFGRGRKGSVESVVEAGGRLGFDVEVIQPVQAEDIIVHSADVRRSVIAGDVSLAARLLGRPHVVRGRVAPGAGRGAGLGFATANVRARTEMVPPEGVYATRAVVDGLSYDGVTSIGRTPTFGGTEVVIETHLFADLGELYGKPIVVRFIERIRDQRKFSGPDELVRQIEADVRQAKDILADDT